MQPERRQKESTARATPVLRRQQPWSPRKRITVENYRDDKLYPHVVRATDEILRSSDFVAPLEVFVRMGHLSAWDVQEWRKGRIPFLEKAIQCGLGKTSRILSILRMHAHDLKLGPSVTVYKRRVRGGGRQVALRFTKTGEPRLEEAYSRHFVVFGKKERRGAHSRMLSAEAVKALSPRAPEAAGAAAAELAAGTGPGGMDA